jgi:cbb3-type cytochrome oxidase subunit 3
MGRCCFTINSSIFLLPLLIQLLILMLWAYRKNNKYQS